MKYVGADLHKKSISLCVVTVADGKRQVARRQRFACQQTGALRRFFQDLGTFQVVVEATASYEWFFLLVDVQGWGTKHEKITRKVVTLTEGKEMHDIATVMIE